MFLCAGKYRWQIGMQAVHSVIRAVCSAKAAADEPSLERHGWSGRARARKNRFNLECSGESAPVLELPA